jgi:hypothetical protein
MGEPLTVTVESVSHLSNKKKGSVRVGADPVSVEVQAFYGTTLLCAGVTVGPVRGNSISGSPVGPGGILTIAKTAVMSILVRDVPLYVVGVPLTIADPYTPPVSLPSALARILSCSVRPLAVRACLRLTVVVRVRGCRFVAAPRASSSRCRARARRWRGRASCSPTCGTSCARAPSRCHCGTARVRPPLQRHSRTCTMIRLVFYTCNCPCSRSPRCSHRTAKCRPRTSWRK